MELASEGPWMFTDDGDVLDDKTAKVAFVLDESDMFFIAHAREDIPYLLARNERMEAVVAAVKEGEEHIQDWDSQDGACNPFWEAWDKACRMAKAVDALEESDGE